jgi:hypothetical protein
LTSSGSVLGLIWRGENPEELNQENPGPMAWKQKQPQNQNSLPAEFAELTTSHGE